MRAALICSLSLLALSSMVASVDRSKFRTCAQSSFCSRARKQAAAAAESAYKLDPASVQPISSTGAEAILVNTKNGVKFRLEVQAAQDRTFRTRIREAFPLKERFETPEVLVEDAPKLAQARLAEQSDSGFTLWNEQGDKVVVQADPFRADYYSDGILVLSANARGLFNFEHTRQKKNSDQGQEQQDEEYQKALEEEEEDLDNISEEDDDLQIEKKKEQEAPPAAQETDNNDDEDNEPGMWEESFGGNTDSKPNGPQSVAMDFAFVGIDHVFGIPEHADRFDLPDTSNGDPFRHYNLDVFEYELWNPMALYAAIPMMVGHNKDRTVGVFWLNAAETWIDVKKSNSGGVLGSLTNLVSHQAARTDTHWMSESGIIDVFVMLGPKPADVSRQYAALTGPTPLPPTFSTAYHQCRWNYNDQDDVRTVAEKFDENDIPMDVMWLDIEHTDGKKYFTWDGRKFSDSLGMIKNLSSVGRKLVTIVDPHIKKDSGYWVHTELQSLGLYVKNKEDKDYEGWCWPGASYYPDFLNPAARQYFADQYHFDKYEGTNLDVYTWNDMNEPSVFNGPEVTMPKDMRHIGGVEHRDVHNIYGHLYVMATFKGHLQRSGGKLRPFILTRSAFAGTQRYAAIWTGDNTADWGHLEASVPMCLSLSVAGMSFCGADVGGFFGNPGGELFVRWYQAASLMPFFRSHAHIDTRRREPWLYSPEEMSRIRDAVRLRYAHLPLIYTLFYEGEMSGTPVMRPVWYEFPDEEEGFGVEDEFLLGDSLLVRPVTKQGATSVPVYFPGEEGEDWYDIFTHERIAIDGTVNIRVNSDRIPIYQRAGSIVPRKERVRRSSALMHDDPYTLRVALDSKSRASGTLYIDDGQSFDYRQGKSDYMEFEYDSGKMKCKQLKEPGYETKSWLERVVIIGWTGPAPTSAVIKTKSGSEETLKVSLDSTAKVLTVRKPGVNMAEEWEIELAK